MKASEMWKLYRNDKSNNITKNEDTENAAASQDAAVYKDATYEAATYEAWAFGSDSDKLAQLVLDGEKTATSSAYPVYELEGEKLPKAGDYSVILDSNDEAVCIIKNIKVYVIPFNQVSDHHAYLEGEGDKSLDYWRNVHRTFFTEELKEAGLEFTEEMQVVCEEFKVVYK